MPNLDYLIYGTDETSLASSIASDALGKPSPNSHSGNPIDQAARSKGNKPQGDSTDTEAKITSRGTGNDGRANVKGNHGKQE